MRKALLFIFFTYTLAISAQKIQVLNSEDGIPLIGATLLFQQADSKTFYRSTDKNGTIVLLESDYKNLAYLLVQTSYIGFENRDDTIFSGKTKIIKLNPKEYLIEDIVVTAQYAPTSIEKSIHKVKVISRKKIEEMAAVNLEDVLTNELNVRISQDNILGSGMSLQGISGQNVKILIDGVPVIGRLDGQIDLNQINLNNIERIEIVEGPLSVNFGSNALAGTINIITKKESKERFYAAINSYTENIGTYNLETNFGFSPNKKQNIHLSLGRNYFDGWSSGDEFLPSFDSQLADSGRVQQWNPKEQYFGRIQYNLKIKDLLFSYKGEVLNEKISNFGLPRRTTNSYVAFDDNYYTKRIDNAVFASGKINQYLSVNWTAAFNDFERIKESKRKDLVTLLSTRIPESTNNDTQDTSDFSLAMSRGSIATTFDSTWYNFELGYDINVENASGKRIDGGEQQIGDYAAFFSSELNFKNLVVKPAIRYSYNTQYDAPLTPSINLKYAKSNRTFRFSYAKGFRAPSLKELYFNFDDVNHSLFGNSDLKAEESNNYTGSVRQKFIIKETLLKAEISGFYNEIYNQISFAQANLTGGDTLVYFNIGERKTKGVNLNFSVLYENFQLNLGGSYIGRSNQLAEESPINAFSYATEYIANLSYLIKKPKIKVAVFAKHQGELPGFGYDQNSEIVEQTIESYQLVDATISRQFWKKRFNAAIGCKNIFDVQNVQATLSGGAHSGSGSSISIGTGRTVFIKLGLKLNKKS